MWQSWMKWKMLLCKWHTFWMALLSNLLFSAILFYVERKWLIMINLAAILPSKSKLSRKFKCFNAVDGSIKILKNAWISKNVNLNEYV